MKRLQEAIRTAGQITEAATIVSVYNKQDHKITADTLESETDNFFIVGGRKFNKLAYYYEKETTEQVKADEASMSSEHLQKAVDIISKAVKAGGSHNVKLTATGIIFNPSHSESRESVILWKDGTWTAGEQ